MFLRYQQVSRLVELVKPASIVEIGTWNGDHAIIMATVALKHHDRVHYTGYDLFDQANDRTDALEFNVRSHHSRAAVHAKLAAFQATHPGFTFELIPGDTRRTLPDTVADFAYIDDLRRKNFVAARALDDDVITGPRLLPTLAKDLAALGPFMDYLCAALDLEF